MTTQALTTDTNEEAEWQALELERAKEWNARNGVCNLKDCTPRHPDKPHPQSYGAHLPLRSEDTWLAEGLAKLTRTTKQERAEYAARPLQLEPCPSWVQHSSYSMSNARALARARKRLPELSIVEAPHA